MRTRAVGVGAQARDGAEEPWMGNWAPLGSGGRHLQRRIEDGRQHELNSRIQSHGTAARPWAWLPRLCVSEPTARFNPNPISPPNFFSLGNDQSSSARTDLPADDVPSSLGPETGTQQAGRIPESTLSADSQAAAQASAGRDWAIQI
jgi:hypothetical protein